LPLLLRWLLASRIADNGAALHRVDADQDDSRMLRDSPSGDTARVEAAQKQFLSSDFKKAGIPRKG